MSLVTTHVLDTALGRPAAGIPVALEAWDGELLGTGVTDEDGRVRELGPETLPAGRYRLAFDIHRYDADAFYPRIQIEVWLDPGAGHYHLPVLLSPFGYSTYRGS